MSGIRARDNVDPSAPVVSPELTVLAGFGIAKESKVRRNASLSHPSSPVAALGGDGAVLPAIGGDAGGDGVGVGSYGEEGRTDGMDAIQGTTSIRESAPDQQDQQQQPEQQQQQQEEVEDEEEEERRRTQNVIIPIPSDLPRTLAEEAAIADNETRNLLTRFLRRQPIRLRRLAEVEIRYDHGKEFFSDAIPFELEGILPNIVYTTRIRNLNAGLARFRTLKDYRPVVRTVSTAFGGIAVVFIIFARAFTPSNQNDNNNNNNQPPPPSPSSTATPGSSQQPQPPQNATTPSSVLLSTLVFSAVLMSIVVFCMVARPFKPLEYVILEIKKWEEEDKPLRLVWRTNRNADVFGSISIRPILAPWSITVDQREPTETEIVAREEQIAAASVALRGQVSEGEDPASVPLRGERFVEVRDWSGALYLPQYEPPGEGERSEETREVREAREVMETKGGGEWVEMSELRTVDLNEAVESPENYSVGEVVAVQPGASLTPKKRISSIEAGLPVTSSSSSSITLVQPPSNSPRRNSSTPSPLPASPPPPIAVPVPAASVNPSDPVAPESILVFSAYQSLTPPPPGYDQVRKERRRTKRLSLTPRAILAKRVRGSETFSGSSSTSLVGVTSLLRAGTPEGASSIGGDDAGSEAVVAVTAPKDGGLPLEDPPPYLNGNIAAAATAEAVEAAEGGGSGGDEVRGENEEEEEEVEMGGDEEVFGKIGGTLVEQEEGFVVAGSSSTVVEREEPEEGK
ncbi:hypothetical protein HDU97_002084 [Phlyctochytrium planicorne]|nr:hypothetical protein HDU97_002084 [Phlyctochytrium planicorne]